jgi:CheY-like chemotaxis protein
MEISPMQQSNNILLVDDEEPNRLLLSKRLEQEGYVVTGAENGRQALEIMKMQRFDLVLLDMYMPEMDGLSTLDAIKSDPVLQDTKVVMLTAANTREHVVHSLSLGAADYLIKPINPVEFKERVRRCLEDGFVQAENIVSANSSSKNGSRILIVDDEPLNLRLLERRLNQSGYQALAARSGREALDLLTCQPIDAVLLDINMPELDGLEVLRRIREVEKWRFIPILMLSADGEVDTVTRSYRLGANDYLVKPYQLHDLQLRLAVALDISCPNKEVNIGN